VTDWQRLVGQTFGPLRADDHTTELQLVAVDDLGRRAQPAGELSCYSLVFRTARRDAFPQATYTLNHAALGRLDVFLVPIGPDEVGMRYEAIFN
jgi:hypothetical protein